MNEVLVQLADILDMSVEGVVQYYPVLREQLIWANSLSFLRSVALFLFGASVVTCVITGVFYADSSNSRDENKLLSKILKISGVLTLVLLVVVFILGVAINIKGADIMMIKTFI